MHIERKHVTASTALTCTTSMTIPGLAAHAAELIPRMMAEAATRGMTVTGPCSFTYDGCDGQADTVFSLTVSLPVDRAAGDGEFLCRTTSAHDCLSTVCHGSIAVIGATWGEFSVQARSMGLPLQPVGREVYLHWLGPDSDANITELQIPLQE